MQIVYLFIAFVFGMTLSNFEKISDEFLTAGRKLEKKKTNIIENEG